MSAPSDPNDNDWDVVPPGGAPHAAPAPSAPSAPAPSSAPAVVSSSSSSASAPSTSSSSSPVQSSSTSAPAPAPTTTSDALDAAFMARVFHDKPEDSRAKWLAVLHAEEFATLADALLLDDSGWASINLPAAVKLRIRAALKAPASAPQGEVKQAEPVPVSGGIPPSAPLSSASEEKLLPPGEAKLQGGPEPLKQLDVVVMDVSGSMKVKSVMDPLKTREDMSKVLFHVFVDKMLGLEMGHAVGLLAFGKDMKPFAITRNYETFHTELGRLDANQSSTRLYDSIQLAGEMMLDYAVKENIKVPMRVFALTDGEDNASGSAAWEVAQWLQDRGIVLDSLPLAGPNSTLQAMSTATGGLCMRVNNEEQGMALFEREAVLHLPSREATPAVARIKNKHELELLCNEKNVVEEVRVAVPQAMSKPAASVAKVESMIAKAKVDVNIAPAIKRISRELATLMAEDQSLVTAFVSEDDMSFWRVIVAGPEKTAYADRFFLLTVQFPNDYPFKPPKIRFMTRIYHANVNNDGGICLDILKDNWSPALSISKVMASIRALLAEPNFNDPLDAFKAQVGLTDRPRYEREAREHALKFAGGSIKEVALQHNLLVN